MFIVKNFQVSIFSELLGAMKYVIEIKIIN